MITCIVCGCTDENACFDNATGATCSWVEIEPGVTQVNGGGFCSFCAENLADHPDVDPDFAQQLHAALDRGLNKPTDTERDAPRVEIVSEHEADLYIRARRAMGAHA